MITPKMLARIPSGRLPWVAFGLCFLASILQARDHTLAFSTSDAGVTRAVTNWGAGTVGGADVVRSSVINMGADQIDVIVMPFPVWDGITNGQISLRSKQQMDYWMSAAAIAGNKPLAISCGTGDGVNPWYITGPNRVDPARWAQCMVATKNYMANRTLAWGQPSTNRIMVHGAKATHRTSTASSRF